MSQSDFLRLHKYISSNSISLVKSIIKSKRIKVSDYDPYDADLSPLLFYAIKYASDDNGELLDFFLEQIIGGFPKIEKGFRIQLIINSTLFYFADISRLRDLRRRTCLLYAIESGSKIAMEKVLLHHAAASMCGIPDERGMTPMLLSCK